MSQYQIYYIDGPKENDIDEFASPLRNGARISAHHKEPQVLSSSDRLAPAKQINMPFYNVFEVWDKQHRYFIGTINSIIEFDSIAIKRAIAAGLKPHP
ncbi:hypothetical protein B1H58_15255 [Pantoea alhagi]|uniref:Uncharacterized protein n=1 Tax=Pantoea alhagi TaxID=1891675 RepID=A0A1W6B830_9GAMM|nr:hypothetical protein [Pantoea alhagi]ARJ43255.1 hypothetical protein B1H58_15255 [Pantoea alhagi]